MQVGSDTTAEMGRWLRGQGLAALVQVHTHPGAWTGHSQTDDDFPIASSEGFVSLVWPHFAAQPVRDPAELGAHRLLHGAWQDLSAEASRELFRVIEGEAMIWAPNPVRPPARRQDTELHKRSLAPRRAP